MKRSAPASAPRPAKRPYPRPSPDDMIRYVSDTFNRSVSDTFNRSDTPPSRDLPTSYLRLADGTYRSLPSEVLKNNLTEDASRPEVLLEWTDRRNLVKMNHPVNVALMLRTLVEYPQQLRYYNDPEHGAKVGKVVQQVFDKLDVWKGFARKLYDHEPVQMLRDLAEDDQLHLVLGGLLADRTTPFWFHVNGKKWSLLDFVLVYMTDNSPEQLQCIETLVRNIHRWDSSVTFSKLTELSPKTQATGKLVHKFRQYYRTDVRALLEVLLPSDLAAKVQGFIFK